MILKRKSLNFLYYFIFILSVLIISSIINNIWDNYRETRQGIIDPGARILILGDSHSANGINPKIIGNAANLSDYGESYIHDYYKLKYVLNKKNSVDKVLLPIDLHSLNDQWKDGILFSGYWDRYIDYYDLGKVKDRFVEYIIRKTFDIDLFDFRGEYEPLFKQIFYIKLKNPVKRYINKFRGIKNKYFHRNREVKGEKRALRHFLGAKYPDRIMVIFLRRILDLCEEKNIKTILVRMPVSVQYFNVAKKLVDVEEYYKIARTIIKKYPNVTLLDLHDVFFHKERWKYYDAEHLNDDGAAIFSRILKEKISFEGSLN